MIKPSKKLKAFFWKRVILAEDAPPSCLWKQIKEPQVSVDEIVELYCDNKAPAAGGGGDTGVVKVTGPSKRTFFSSEENQKLGIGLGKCPKDVMEFKRALISYDTTKVN